jgi:LytR cell envelope-related transcriptional attenuator
LFARQVRGLLRGLLGGGGAAARPLRRLAAAVLERDVTATRQRSGAHRPRRRGGALVAPLLLAVVVVAAVLAGIRWLPSLEPTRAGGGSAASGTTTSVTPTAAASSGSAAPGSTSARAGSSPKPAESAETVDRSLPVTVLNGTGRAGLATRVAATLRSAGWAVDGLGNLPEGAASSTVYYPQTRLRATARAVSEDLPGTQRIVRSSRFGSLVTVVLGPDYVG